MPSVFSLIGQSWTFARKQPILMQTGLLLLFLPLLVMGVLSDYLESIKDQAVPNEALTIMLSAIGIVSMSVVIVWGTASVLLIGSRLLAAKSGRSRTSLSNVSSEAASFIVPLLLTKILRSIFCVLWGILLIIPGIIYAFNTAFYAIIVVLEGVQYRKALKMSSALMEGRRLEVYWKIIALSLLLFVPPSIVAAAIQTLPYNEAPYVADVVNNLLYAGSLVLFTLSMILLYGSLKPSTKPITGGGKKAVSKKK